METFSVAAEARVMMAEHVRRERQKKKKKTSRKRKHEEMLADVVANSPASTSYYEGSDDDDDGGDGTVMRHHAKRRRLSSVNNNREEENEPEREKKGRRRKKKRMSVHASDATSVARFMEKESADDDAMDRAVYEAMKIASKTKAELDNMRIVQLEREKKFSAMRESDALFTASNAAEAAQERKRGMALKKELDKSAQLILAGGSDAASSQQQQHTVKNTGNIVAFERELLENNIMKTVYRSTIENTRDLYIRGIISKIDLPLFRFPIPSAEAYRDHQSLFAVWSVSDLVRSSMYLVALRNYCDGSSALLGKQAYALIGKRVIHAIQKSTPYQQKHIAMLKKVLIDYFEHRLSDLFRSTIIAHLGGGHDLGPVDLQAIEDLQKYHKVLTSWMADTQHKTIARLIYRILVSAAEYFKTQAMSVVYAPLHITSKSKVKYIELKHLKNLADNFHLKCVKVFHQFVLGQKNARSNVRTRTIDWIPLCTYPEARRDVMHQQAMVCLSCTDGYKSDVDDQIDGFEGPASSAFESDVNARGAGGASSSLYPPLDPVRDGSMYDYCWLMNNFRERRRGHPDDGYTSFMQLKELVNANRKRHGQPAMSKKDKDVLKKHLVPFLGQSRKYKIVLKEDSELETQLIRAGVFELPGRLGSYNDDDDEGEEQDDDDDAEHQNRSTSSTSFDAERRDEKLVAAAAAAARKRVGTPNKREMDTQISSLKLCSSIQDSKRTIPSVHFRLAVLKYISELRNASMKDADRILGRMHRYVLTNEGGCTVCDQDTIVQPRRQRKALNVELPLPEEDAVESGNETRVREVSDAQDLFSRKVAESGGEEGEEEEERRRKHKRTHRKKRKQEKALLTVKKEKEENEESE